MAATFASLCVALIAQTPAPETKIIKPIADKAANTVTLPAMFWDSHSADWIEVAVCGKPSDFLHETLLATTTTRALLEQAMRDIGCRDGDTWADSVKDFPRVRGDRFIVLLDFQRDGKKETFSLDELLEYQFWGVPLGPYGFSFRGDPDRAQRAAAATKPTLDVTDATRILKDDPQIALQFKGLQSMSQAFADHPLAYDEWEFETINWSRNYTLLPGKVYDSNGDIPVTMTLKRVTEEQLLTESAKVWHDPAAAQAILKQLPIAKKIDADKEEYLKLRAELSKARAANPTELNTSKLTVQVASRIAEIEKNYAIIDAAWTNWAADHLKWETTDAKMIEMLKDQSARWREHMNLEAERTAQLAIAEQARWEAFPHSVVKPNEGDFVLLATLHGKELEARSRALLAEIKQPTDRWSAENARLDPKNDPRDVWIKDVQLHVALNEARKAAADAGIAYGTSLQKTPADPAEQTKLAATYTRATIQATLAEQRLALARVDFEIEKREAFDKDPDLPTLKKQREQIQQQIKDMEKALAPTAG